ncbi:hypothetical protein RB595_004235 [Gaeumannomyces hyphopodioides]
MAEPTNTPAPSSPPRRPDAPILIVGAGVSGLLLAQHLRREGVAFAIFDRDEPDDKTRGVGWGLTLHWSLPQLRALLPDELVRRLPEAYVDRAAVVDRGCYSSFPFYDLSTGELRAATPGAPESKRIRVSRERFRALLATGIDVQWRKTAIGYETADDAGSVTVHFDDGTSHGGRFLVACDGGNSRIRRTLLGQKAKRQPPPVDGDSSGNDNDNDGRSLIPVGVMGFRVDCTPAQAQAVRDLDPFFFQGTASANNTYMYFSVLDSPGSPPENTDGYACQVVVSWALRDNAKLGLGGDGDVKLPHAYPTTNEARLAFVKSLAAAWADPFASLVRSVPDGTEVRALELYDWPPPADFRGEGPVALAGDAFHQMCMYRGEGANHAVLDVADLVETVMRPHLVGGDSPPAEIRAALDRYEAAVVRRARPAVLASRRACLDAHEWGRITDQSPLLSRRSPQIEFDESNLL